VARFACAPFACGVFFGTSSVFVHSTTLRFGRRTFQFGARFLFGLSL
jgi:hypothetical protein